MPLHIFKDIDALSTAVANWMVDKIDKAILQNGRCTLALSGGSTPLKLHALLASPAFNKKIDWTKLHIFWGDERAVPFTDNRNNAKMAFDTLLHFVPVPKAQIHVMRTDISPEDAAREYDTILHTYFDNSSFSFDIILLGMGDDGHTLSLFPGTEVLHEEKKWCTSFYLQQQQMHRITLTKTIANTAANIAFLTTGANKAEALKQVLQGNYNPQVYPSQLIKPLGELHWFVDESAATLLKK